MKSDKVKASDSKLRHNDRTDCKSVPSSSYSMIHLASTMLFQGLNYLSIIITILVSCIQHWNTVHCWTHSIELVVSNSLRSLSFASTICGKVIWLHAVFTTNLMQWNLQEFQLNLMPINYLLRNVRKSSILEPKKF